MILSVLLSTLTKNILTQVVGHSASWALGTTKKPAICHVHLATCTNTVHMANRWPRVLRVLDPGVAKCTIGRVYSNTRIQLDTCIVIHVSDCLPRVL